MLRQLAAEAMPETSHELLGRVDREADPNVAKIVGALEVAEQSPLPVPPLCKTDCPRIIGPVIP